MRWQAFMRLEHRRLDDRREGMLRRALGEHQVGRAPELGALRRISSALSEGT